MRDFLSEIHDRILVYDGSKGYMLQKLGLKGGECAEEWNISKPEIVKQIYRSYKEAGADVIQTNTFTGSRVHLKKYSLENKVYEINYEGARLAREVMGSDGFVAASIGPCGILFEPSGELTFDTAYDIYKEQVKALADGGVDIINFETFTDLAELRAALLAAKENTRLPVICSLAFEANGRTLMGTDPYTAVKVLKSLGADMVGTNCSFGAGHMVGIVGEMYEAGGTYLSVKPNAGLPVIENGVVVYDSTPESFASHVTKFVSYGARLIGGCCGTTPDYIKAIKQALMGVKPVVIKEGREDVITSSSSILHIKDRDLEGLNIARLNITNLDEVLDEALDISSEGYDAVLVKAGDSEKQHILAEAVNIAQGYIKAPFILEVSNPDVLGYTLRIYRGIAGVVGNAAGNDDLNREIAAVAARYGSVLLDMDPV